MSVRVWRTAMHNGTRGRNGLLKVLEYRRQEQRRRQIAVGQAEAGVRQSLDSVAAAEQKLRHGVTRLGDGVQDGAALRAAGRHAAYLRRGLQQEQRRLAAALGELKRARERRGAAAREQAAIERLFARRQREREMEQARMDQAMHDESAAAHARATRPGR